MSYGADEKELSEAGERQPKSAVDYSPARTKVNGEIEGDACGRCENYRMRFWRTSGACVKVEGAISGRYWCRLFEAKRWW